MDEYGLSRLQLRHVHQRLPRGQRAHRYRRSFRETQRRGLRSDLFFGDGNVLRPAAAKSRVTINRVTRFEFCNFYSRFLNDPGDVVPWNQWQVRSEFSSEFTAE